MKTTKKIASAVLAVLILLSCCPLAAGLLPAASAEEFLKQGTITGGLVWRLAQDGTLYISGENISTEDIQSNLVQYITTLMDMYRTVSKMSEYNKRVVFEDGIDRIPQMLPCFTEAAVISVPVSVTAIEDGAFLSSDDVYARIGENVAKSILQLFGIREGTIGCDGLQYVLYAGSEKQWKKIECSENENSALQHVTVHTADHKGTVLSTTVTEEATCNIEGCVEETESCAVCGAELSRRTLPVDPHHTPAEPVTENETQSTCSFPGSYDEVVYCTVCGAELERNTVYYELAPHTPGEPQFVEEIHATCTEMGRVIVAVYCTVCGEKLNEYSQPGEAPNHTPGEPVRENEVPPTCAAPGSVEEVVYCTACGAEISRTKIKLHTDKDAHDYGDWEYFDDVSHCKVCRNDPTHVFYDAHTWDEGVEIRKPTYKEEGSIKYTCAVCGGTRYEPENKLPPLMKEDAENSVTLEYTDTAFDGEITFEVTPIEDPGRLASMLREPYTETVAFEIRVLTDGKPAQPGEDVILKFLLKKSFPDMDSAEVYRLAEDGSAVKLATENTHKYVQATTASFGTFVVVDASTRVPFAPGKVAGEAEISAADARLALRGAVGLEDYQPFSREFAAADADRSGDITAADARIILRAAVGLETLPAGRDAWEPSDLQNRAAMVYSLCTCMPECLKFHYIFEEDGILYFSEFVQISEEGAGDAFGMAYSSYVPADGCYNIPDGEGYLCVKMGVPKEPGKGSTSFDLAGVAARAEEIGEVSWS